MSLLQNRPGAPLRQRRGRAGLRMLAEKSGFLVILGREKHDRRSCLRMQPFVLKIVLWTDSGGQAADRGGVSDAIRHVCAPQGSMVREADCADAVRRVVTKITVEAATHGRSPPLRRRLMTFDRGDQPSELDSSLPDSLPDPSALALLCDTRPP